MELLTQKDVRHSVKLGVEKGIVFLRAPGVPSLACSLTDLSQHGCNCTVCLSSLREETAADWKQRLTVGSRLGMDISAPPHLPGLHVESVVRHAFPDEENTMRLDLRFQEVEAQEACLLRQALLALATQKLRPNGVLTEASTAALHRSSGLRRATRGSVHHHADPFRGKRIGEVLVLLGKLTEAEANEAERATRPVKERIGHYLLRRGYVSSLDLCGALSLQTGLPMTDLSQAAVPPELTAAFSYLTMLKYSFIPFNYTANSISIAATHPLPPRVTRELEDRCGKRVKVFLAEDDLVNEHLYALQPKKARKHRKFTRYELNVPISFQCCDRRKKSFDQNMHDGQTVNVGEGGLMFQTGADLRRHDGCVRACFSLKPHTVEGIFGVRFIQTNEHPGPNEQPFTVGLEVLEMAPEERAKLKQVCIQVGLTNATREKWSTRRSH